MNVPDIIFITWKAEHYHKHRDDLGYLLIPDEILVPYALKDVSAPMIAAPQIIKRLMSDKTWEYYRDYRHHLVTDIFTQFALLGLPINRAKIDILRDLYSYARELLEKKFIHELRIESGQLLLKAMLSASKDPKCFGVYQEILQMAAEGHHVEAEARLKEFVLPDLDLIKHTTSKQDFEMAKAMAAEMEKKVLPALHHFLEAPNFNVRSADCKKRWLFDVKGMTPVKTTNRKEAGLPSIPWSRVQNLPPHIAAQYAPACDKQTLKMLADDCGIPEDHRDPKFLMKAATKGEIFGEFTMDDLKRDEKGELVHPPHDLHWSLVEWVFLAPRELFDSDIQRSGVGKTGKTLGESRRYLTFAHKEQSSPPSRRAAA